MLTLVVHLLGKFQLIPIVIHQLMTCRLIPSFSSKAYPNLSAQLMNHEPSPVPTRYGLGCAPWSAIRTGVRWPVAAHGCCGDCCAARGRWCCCRHWALGVMNQALDPFVRKPPICVKSPAIFHVKWVWLIWIYQCHEALMNHHNHQPSKKLGRLVATRDDHE